MSQHPSLKTSQVGIEQRTVLKRFEKIKVLHEKQLWTDRTSIFHLPKVKTVRVKVKKGTAEAAPKEGVSTPPAAAPTTTTVVAPAKKGPASAAPTAAKQAK